MIVVRSNRMERLLGALDAHTAAPVGEGDPLVPELIVVPSAGMAAYVAGGLAARRGVAAGLDLVRPRAFVERLLRSALGKDRLWADLWDGERLAWTMLRGLPGWASDPVIAGAGPLARWAAEPDAGLRWQLVRRLGGVFEQYAVYRPDLVLGWERGEEPDSWEATLWRRLRAELGGEHVAALASRAIARLQAGEAARPVAPRVSVFGLSTLPPVYLSLLAALSSSVPVALFLLSPSGAFLADVVSPREEAARARRLGAAEPAARRGHPLLAQLGRLSRDVQQLLLDLADVAPLHEVDGYASPEAEGPGATLLARLQRDLLHDASPPAAEARAALRPGDRSLEVHAAAGPVRELEAVRDALLDALAADPTLRPRDVLVLVPDMAAYGPLIDAVFDVDRFDPLHLPYAIADRPLAAGNPAGRAVLRLLGLVGGRLSAPDLLDLLALPPVRARFGLDEAAVGMAVALVGEAGATWGADAAHRAAAGQPADPVSTWQFALDRVVLGHAMGPVPDAAPLPEVGGVAVAPLGDVGDGLAEVAGAVCALVERVTWHADALAAPRPMAAWAAALDALLHDLVLPPEGPDAALFASVQAVRDGVAAAVRVARAAGADEPVPVGLVRALLEGFLTGERRPGGFLRAGVTFCELVPMRAVPARVVALVGLSDGAFPRADAQLGFDRIARAPRRGDRSRRLDDRHLFLETLLSASDRVILTYTASDPGDGSERPPSVVVAELLDAVDAYAVAPGGGPARAHVVVHHPLQPFGRAVADAGADRRLATFDPGPAAGSELLLRPPRTSADFLRAPLGAPPEDGPPSVALPQLVRFFDDPVKALFQHRLGARDDGAEATVMGREPLALGPLEAHGVASRAVALLEAGLSEHAVVTRLRAEGALPLGSLGLASAARPLGRAAELVAAVAEDRAGGPRDPVVLDHEVGGVTLSGRIDGLFTDAAGLPTRVVVSPSGVERRKGRARLGLWITHLALHVATGHGWRSVAALYGSEAEGAVRIGLPPVPVDAAREALEALLALRARGMCAPLRFHADVSHALFRAPPGAGRDADDGDDPGGGAASPMAKAWEMATAYDLLARRARAQLLHDAAWWDDGVALPAAEPTPARSLAQAVFGPLFAAVEGA